MVKLQLELGAKGPTTFAAANNVKKCRVAGRRRDVQHRAELLLGGRIYDAPRFTTSSCAPSLMSSNGFKVGDPMSEDASRRHHARSRNGVLDAQVEDARRKDGRHLLDGHRLPAPGN